MPGTNTKTLPLVLQHVRELIEAQMPVSEGKRYKIVTPFPPELNDFPDFEKGSLTFSNPENDAAAAQKDTWNAYEFFTDTDGLFYNYSYGIRSAEQTLSQVCKKFTNDAVFTEKADTSFIENFKEKKIAFLERFTRSTIGDLGRVDFFYTTPTDIRWNTGKIQLSEADCERLKEKALTLYKSIESTDNSYLKTLIAEIEVSNFSKIEYDFGYFDVVRAWMDPQLFESDCWKFNSEKDALYADNSTDFTTSEIRLCFAQRFYVIKNYSGTAVASASITPITAVHFNSPVSTLEVRDHRRTPAVHDHRIKFRDIQLQKKLGQAAQMQPTVRAGYVWVNNHWERTKTDKQHQAKSVVVPATTPQPNEENIYRVAAVKCRIIPWKPGEVKPN